MAALRVGIIGCGGRGRAHALGYSVTPGVELVACADPNPEARAKVAGEFGIARSYESYQEMLDQEPLDVVSICTWTGQHREMVTAAAQRPIKAIHSEKPVACTWGDAKALYQACVDNGVVITFCHQRRFEQSFLKARALLDEGAIGQLQRMEGACHDLFDWGTHWFDMFFFYNHDEPAEWVIGQIDVAEKSQVFGVDLDTSGLSWIRWRNGVEGLLTTGAVAMQGPRNRLLGSEGIIEVGQRGQTPLRLWRHGGQGWEEPELDLGVPAPAATTAAIGDLVEALQSGREPELAGRKALQATELIFATYESSRRRAKITLPLDVEDSALLSMIEQHMIGYCRQPAE